MSKQAGKQDSGFLTAHQFQKLHEVIEKIKKSRKRLKALLKTSGVAPVDARHGFAAVHAATTGKS